MDDILGTSFICWNWFYTN